MEYLRSCAKEIGITISEEQLSQFEQYYKMLIEKNKVMNLTARKKRSDRKAFFR